MGPHAEADASSLLRNFVTTQVADRLIEAGGVLGEERRLVTALFADLSGFTPLSERLDPEDLLEVIDPVISGLSSVVGRYDGFVEKFAGDALLALFGAPVAHEDDVPRALSVALEMHAELAQLREGLGPDAGELTLHIGVNSGHGVARMIGSEVRLDYGVLGDSVILAQRLESVTPPGETYVGESTYLLARGRFLFEELPPVAVKGKAEPVPVYRLLGPSPVEASADLTATSPLIGRSRELAAVVAAMGERPVVVQGEAGVGKSRLTAAVRAALTQRGASWLEVRCVSYGRAFPYRPVANLLRRWATAGGGEVADPDVGLRARLGQLGQEPLAAALGALLGGPPPSEEPELARRQVHEALISWLVALGQRGELVLAVEDVHWIDPATMGLLDAIAREAPGIGMYLTSRETETQVGGVASTVIQLGPLDQEGVAGLARAVLEGDPPADLIPGLSERSGGNPFYVGELVRSLRETGQLVDRGGRWRLARPWEPAEVPDSVEGVIAERLDRLSPGARVLIETAAVIGRRVAVPLLVAVVPTSVSLPADLDALDLAGFVDRLPDGETVDFHHALMQEVAYGRILKKRRRELHSRVAEAAEALYGSGDDRIELLARHRYLGGGGSIAVRFLIRAGARAASLFANEEAIIHYRHALELVRQGDAEERLAEVLLLLGDLHDLRGEYSEALDLYVEARDLGAGINAWRGMASTLRKQGRYREALDTVEEAIAALPASADRGPLILERVGTLYLAGDPVRAAADAREAISDGPRDEVAVQLLVRLARAEAIRGRFEEALEASKQAATTAERIGNPRLQVAAFRVIGDAAAELDRHDEAAGALRSGIEVAERIGDVEELASCLVNLGMLELDRGNLDVAIALDRRAVDAFEAIDHGAGRAVSAANLADKLARAGELEEARTWAERALDLARAIGHRLATADAVDTMAVIEGRSGRPAAAAARAEEAAGLYEEAGSPHRAAETWTTAAEWWSAAGEAARAEVAAARATTVAP